MDLPLSALWWFIAVFGILIVGHESAHVIMTRLLGGQVEGWIRPSWFTVGIRIRVDDLSVRQIVWTIVAAPITEAGIIALAIGLQPILWRWWLGMLAGHWLLNFIPWPGIPNDGHTLWWLGHYGHLPEN